MANTTFYPNIQQTPYEKALDTHLPVAHVVDRFLGVDAGTNEVAGDTDVPFELAGTVQDTYGSWVQILDSGDTPLVLGNKHFSISKVLPINATASKLFKVQIAWGDPSGQAAALAKGDYVELIYQTGASLNDHDSISVFTPLIPAGKDVWARVRSTSATAVDFDFLFAIREV